MHYLGTKSQRIYPRCGNNIRFGGGHGDDFGFSFSYRDACGQFIAWDSFGMDLQKTQQIQDFLKARFKEKE